MEIKDLKSKIKSLHDRRFFRFKTIEIPKEKKYIESKKNSLLISGGTLLIAAIALHFSDYSQNVLKICIFALLFNLYKIYQVFTIPLLRLNEEGISLRTVKISWKRIDKFHLNWNHSMLNLEILLNNGKTVKQKVENFVFMDYVFLHHYLKAFKKKYRNKYKFVYNSTRNETLK